MTKKKKSEQEIRTYLYDVTYDTAESIRDKIKDLIMNNRDLDGNRIRSAVTVCADR